MAGPSTPGSTQAVESVANIRGRSRSGRLRPIATYAIGGIVPAPRPWMNRAATRTSIVRGQPADEQADREEPEAGGEGPAEAALVDEPAHDGDADQRPEEERGEDPAVQLHPAELARDDRHDGRDGEGLEGDERDGQDEADGQGTPLGGPEAVVDGAGGRLHAI